MSAMFLERISSLSERRAALRYVLSRAGALRSRWSRWRSADCDAAFARLAALLAEDPVLDVAEFEGRFALSSRGHLFRRIVETGEYEPTLTALCREFLDPGRDAIDVGANIGFHTVLFAKRLPRRRVLSVEPTRAALTRLRRNIALNGVESNVCVFEGAASDASRQMEIKTIPGLEEYSTLGELAHPSVAGAAYVTEFVEARKLDQLADERQLDCGFIKIDAEGAEHSIFEGARGLLTKHRPVVVSELSDSLLRENGSSAREVVRFLESLDYVVRDPIRPAAPPGFRPFGDMICIPKEHRRIRMA